jgi:hypothetical protein
MFACLSGDYNPLHVDPVVARRTLVGGRAVHGIHQALSALEALLEYLDTQNRPHLAVVGFKAQFLKPVLVGDIVDLYLSKLTDESCTIASRIAGEIVCRISVQFGSLRRMADIDWPILRPGPVRELPFAALTGKMGRLALGLDPSLAGQMFPRTTSRLQAGRLAATLALSRLVGMECPGLHSLFGEASIRYDGASESHELTYRVEETDERFNRLCLSVHGALVHGQLVVFFRPPPQPQPGMTEVMRAIEPGSFAQSVALIVGGSRGLGEITAKIIAAGGGLPIITYYQGAAEAEAICSEIRSAGCRCKLTQLDVKNPAMSALDLETPPLVPRSLYYFATPKIFGRRRGFFDHEMHREFHEVYVTAFGRMVDRSAAQCPETFRVFYPSSVAVSESRREMAEYAMAKRTGEELCAFYNEHARQIEIIVERLPRIRTDQTNTLLPFPAEGSLEVMSPLVRRMESVFTV